MKIKTTIISAAILLSSGSAFADSNVTGIVFNKETSEPLGFATVSLIDPETGKASRSAP